MQRQLWITVIVAAIVAIIIGFVLHLKSQHPEQKMALENGTILPTPLALDPFKLTGSNGNAITNDSLRGHWTLIFFGFTHCPMICPTTLAAINQAYQQINTTAQAHAPQVLFISVDPERDTPTVIRRYLANFNPNFLGATASKAQLDALAKQLGVAYMKALKSDDPNYDIQHTGSILVINPQGEWVAVLSSPKSSNTIARDLMRLQKN